MCAVVKYLLRTDTGWNNRRLTTKNWMKSRRYFANRIRLHMPRDLELYEEQMIFFAKSCLICHQQANLRTCTKCYSANYCIEHVEQFATDHSLSCNDLLLYLNLAIKFPYHIDLTKTFVDFPCENRPTTDMISFIQQYYSLGLHIKNPLTWMIGRYFYSEYASSPLTLYYGMKDANLLHFLNKQCYVCVHIIAADLLEKVFVSAWEFLLHLLPNIKNLNIVLIAPELNNEYNSTEVCSRCVYRCQTVHYQCHSMSYDNYVDSELYESPKVIVGLQVDFNDGQTWSQLISQLQNQYCPLLLTATSRFKLQQNKNKLEEILGSPLNFAYHDVNKFSSISPTRDSESGGVFFRNQFLTLFPNLTILD